MLHLSIWLLSDFFVNIIFNFFCYLLQMGTGSSHYLSSANRISAKNICTVPLGLNCLLLSKLNLYFYMYWIVSWIYVHLYNLQLNYELLIFFHNLLMDVKLAFGSYRSTLVPNDASTHNLLSKLFCPGRTTWLWFVSFSLIISVLQAQTSNSEFPLWSRISCVV